LGETAQIFPKNGAFLWLVALVAPLEGDVKEL